MSDAFINTLVKMAVGEKIVYHAASPASRDKVKNFINSFSAKQHERVGEARFSIDTVEQGRHSKLTITRIQ